MALAVRVLQLTLFSLYLHAVLAQHLPHNACSSIFHYQRQGDRWIGLFTPPQDGLRSISWTVRFASRGLGKVSSFEPYPNKDTALQNMHNGGRAQGYVRFEGYEDELPKMVRIELNGELLCFASDYGAPQRTFTRELNMAVSSSTSHKGSDSRPNTRRPVTVTTRTPVFFEQPVTFATRPTNPTPRPLATVGSPTVDLWHGNPFLRPMISKDPTVIVETRVEPAANECGVEGLGALQYSGEDLPRGRFPWLAALYHDSNHDPNKIELVYKCVTTVISARTVITAAHCIYGFTPAQLRVYVGRHDATMHPEKYAILMTVEHVRTQPDYVGTVVPDSDLGLLVLSDTIQFSNYVRPICLWSSSSVVGIDDSEEMAVAGWGINEKLQPTRFPTTVSVRTVSREECLREMITAKDFLTSRTLCAGNSKGHGPCLGDSGGGLMVLRENRWFVRGIVSLAKRIGNGCDLSRYVIYCDVARHLSWVERNIVR